MSTEEPMSIEDRVRTATRVGATLVRDIGPLAAPDPVRLRRRPAPGTRRWLSWGVPLAAALAVVLVALSLVAVRHFSAPAPAPGQPAALPASVPRYYAALNQEETFSAGSAGSAGSSARTGPAGSPVPEAILVGDDRTGKAIATVNPPRGMLFDSVQGASDDRTFVVMATRLAKPDRPPYTWYLLRIAPGTAHPDQLTKLPIKLPGSIPAVRVYALSPDGRDLAIESLDDRSGKMATLGTTLAVYSVSSGAELRAWTTNKDITQGLAEDTLSWLSGGRQLVFSDLSLGAPRRSYQQSQLRTIHLTGSGTDLLADSRVLFALSTPVTSPGSCATMHATPDGGTVICGFQYGVLSGGTNAGCANGGLEFTAYSVPVGKPVRVLYRYPGPCDNGRTEVLWTDASAKYVIGALEIDVANQGGPQTGRLGVIIDGRLRLLPMAKALPAAAYLTAAF